MVSGLALLTSLIYLAPAQAAFNGNPVGTGAQGSATNNTDPNNTWTSALFPNPAISQPAGTCPWITNGLNAQGFTVANKWTINYITLAGSLSLAYYGAYVAPWPTVTMPVGSYPAIGASKDFGGATIETQYASAGTDPTANYGYIQGVYTNSVLNNTVKAQAYNAGGGYYEYLDNAGTYSTNPSYPHDANNAFFSDQPGRILAPYPNGLTPIIWEAQVFVDTVTPNAAGGGGTINIYGNGIWWGFKLTEVPEPASLALLALGSGLFLIRRRHGTAGNR